MTTVNEIGAKGLADGDINEERASRFFLVRSSTPIDAVAAATASGIPDYFDPHPSNSAYLLKNKRGRAVSEDSGRYAWEIQLDYSNRIIHPLDMPAQIEWDFSEASEAYFLDWSTPDPKPVKNSAGQNFEALPERESGVIVCHITKNVATDFDTSLFLSARENVNSAGFTVDGVSLDVHQAKFSGANVTPPALSAGEWFRTVKMTLKFKQSWDDVFNDEGYQQLASDGINLVDCYTNATDPNNKPEKVVKPWPLDGTGHKKANATDTPEPLTFKPYEELDFADLSALLS